MFVTKLKILGVMLLVVGVAAGGVLRHGRTATTQGALAETPAAKPEADRKAEAKPITVRVVEPKAGGMKITVSLPTEVRPNWSVKLLPLVSGILTKVDVDVGDSVKKGQVLGVIYAPHLAKKTAEAEGRLELAKARVEEAEASLAITETEHKAAKDLLAIREEAAKKASATSQELVSSRSDVSIKASKIRYAQAVLRRVKANVTVAEAICKTARIWEEYTRIIAPFDGDVVSRIVDPGMFVEASDAMKRVPMFVVATRDRLRIVAQVPERYLAFLQQGDPVEFETSVLPGIRLKDLKISRFYLGLGEKERSTLVEIDIANPIHVGKQKIRLFPGMTGSVTIHMRTQPDPKHSWFHRDV